MTYKPQAFGFTYNGELTLPLGEGTHCFDVLVKHNPKGYPNGDKNMAIIVRHDGYNKAKVKGEGWKLIGLVKGEDQADVYDEIMKANWNIID